jgi:hypothetical protein
MQGFVALTLLVAAPTFACINTYKTVLGELKRRGGKEAEITSLISQLESEHIGKPGLETSTDYAVGLLMTGKYAEGVALLREVEKKYPGHAKTAANLGTGLELSGADAEALRWIREGMRRDPKEHFGTEWLHVRILEAKLALAKDESWLDKNRVIGIDFGNDAAPKMPTEIPVDLPLDHAGRPIALSRIESALDYQLNERTYFVAPPDSVVADLYFSAGDIANLDSDYGSLHDYEEARRYGFVNHELIERRMGYARRLEEAHSRKTEKFIHDREAREAVRAELKAAQGASKAATLWAALALTAAVLATLGVFAVRRARRRRS